VTLALPEVAEPCLVDTAVWIRVRDRRHPELADWFNEIVRLGRVLTCAVVRIEAVRGAPNPRAAVTVADRIDALRSLAISEGAEFHARAAQLALARDGSHRRVPAADLLIAGCAIAADVPVLHYDADYPRIASVCDLREIWMAEPGALA
jgi:predicted nucleic acid-binding protein